MERSDFIIHRRNKAFHREIRNMFPFNTSLLFYAYIRSCTNIITKMPQQSTLFVFVLLWEKRVYAILQKKMTISVYPKLIAIYLLPDESCYSLISHLWHKASYLHPYRMHHRTFIRTMLYWTLYWLQKSARTLSNTFISQKDYSLTYRRFRSDFANDGLGLICIRQVLQINEH